MNIEEQLSNQERLLDDAFRNNMKACIIWKMFEVYEDLYGEIKQPSREQESRYIQLYFKYSAYMERN